MIMVDFKKIASNSFLYNFHSHTQFCDGRAPMREFVESAIAQGFTDYGFSPHSPIPFASSCNMAMSDVDAYFREFENLKTEFAGKINLYKSMEIDYLGKDWGPSVDYFNNLGLDYKIGSVHFIPCNDIYVDTDGSYENFKVKMGKFFHNDIRHVVETFYAQTLKMIACGGFDIIGHFDKISQNASCFQPGIEYEPWYENLVMQVINALRESKLIVEINTKSYNRNGRLFPNKKYFPILKRFGIPVVFNSDAHYPNLINAGRQEAYALYQNA